MIQGVHGIVLRAEDQAEYDQRVTLYTKEWGKLKAKVAGVKKTVSKLRAVATPFVESRLQLYLHGTPRAGLRDPGKIVGGEILDYHMRLRNEWERAVQCAAAGEILDLLTQTFYPNPQEYGLLTDTLAQMEFTANPLLVRLRFTLVLLKLLGYSLRHHALWKSYSDWERELLLELARWDARETRFSAEEVRRMESLVGLYLANYLPRPLKTEVFLQKLGMAVDYMTPREVAR